ncbi:ABC transporter ATP-binding protein [Xanthomonas sp. A2111]|uniref:ABC transporter ATP-binding protein n=1 Tax=Xanthomonas hawaiiensis TaxID=3003247 RepID=A0ABU2I0I6_9XANT|nr:MULTISPECIES: ABC transporter ATP-binding protein [unclassified Xanthomonas]MBO9830319.1 ABC transporter ATP-binding protein [Xanthomonas sp. A2111]MBO9872105.1 ABC transporter ATP-binding protein [Xanthomonas sp. D-93]MDS9991158.1 ABC transporter ATP-binding protein [Xanthomonas sp. A2111]WNH43000.1 ABC transporter ATP-binding protein [Xanthomonas sp. A6251]
MSARPDPASHLLRAFIAVLGGGERLRIAWYVLLSLLGALAGALAAVALVPLVQPGHVLTLAGHALPLPEHFLAQTLLFVAASSGFALLRWWGTRLAADLASRHALDLRRQVHARLLQAPLPALADASSAEIANLLTYNVEIVVQGFSALLQLLVAAITAAVSLAAAFLVSPILVLALPPLLALGLLAFRIAGHEQARVSREYVADMTRLFWLSEDFPRRLRHVRSFAREAREQEAYDAIAGRLAHGYARQQALVASGRLVLELAAVAAIAAIMLLAGMWHGIDRGALITVGLLLGRLLPYLVSTRQSVQQLRSAAPALELWQRYVALGAPSPAVPIKVAAQSAAAVEAAVPAPIQIERIGLAPPLAAVALTDLVLAPGTLTLISGPSGVGKSSLMDALAGMVAPPQFAAHCDGRALDFAGYRAALQPLAYVAQGVRPWQHTVRQCLAWAAPAASEAAMWEALRDVGLAARLQGGAGLDTAAHGAGARLSGGELQRLLLAQVLLRQPRVALLDEATSALDAVAEQQVLSTLRRRLPQTALVAVSHRLGLSAIADQCVMVQRGTAAPLLLADRAS